MLDADDDRPTGPGGVVKAVDCIVVTGSRSFADSPDVVGDAWRAALSHIDWREKALYHGGARGVDQIISGLVGERVMQVCFRPAWKSSKGRGAGHARNGKMLTTAVETYGADRVALVAVWDGSSKGTRHCMDRARELGITVLHRTVEAAR